jgi:hypothetical protein
LLCWTNAYRSGDYVGRYLWRSPQCTFLYDTDQVTSNATRSEVCLGAGAHTGYFDERETELGEQLNDLIARASKSQLQPQIKE